jgi:hypothetical protein
MIYSKPSSSLQDEETKAVRGHRSLPQSRDFAMPEARSSSARFWSAPALWRFFDVDALPKHAHLS